MRRWLAPVLALALGGCAPLPVAPPTGEPAATSPWALHRARLEAVRAWSLQGRAAIQTEREGVTATVRWEQRGQDYVMRFIGPFAQGSFELAGGAEGVVLRTPEGGALRARDPEALLEQALGWSLPVAGLNYWIRGIPDPAREASQLRLDEFGRMTDVEQDGWRISVLRYTRLDGLDLPEKLFLESRRLKLRIAVQAWEQAGP